MLSAIVAGLSANVRAAFVLGVAPRHWLRNLTHQNLPRTPTVNTLPIGLARNESYPYPCVVLLRFTKGGFRSKRFVTSRNTCVPLRNAPGLYERWASTVVNEPM